MRKTKIAVIPLLFLPICSCSTARVTATDNSGAGYSMLTPAKATQIYIVNNDLPFAKQVLSHNSFCAKQPGCRKASQ